MFLRKVKEDAVEERFPNFAISLNHLESLKKKKSVVVL